MDYLQWQSDISLNDVFAGGESFTYPTMLGQGFVYLTELKSEKSRSVLMFKSEKGSECITPQSFNLRTKINEYGGKPFWLLGDHLYFCNQQDQCLYRQKINVNNDALTVGVPERITPKPSPNCVLMYTDLLMLNATKLLVIAEQANPSDSACQNSASIRYVDLNQKDQAPVIVEQGADFYSNLVLAPNSKTIAWVQWNHPSMPWDVTQVFTANLFEDTNLSLADKQQIKLGDTASVCQLHFASNGHLFLSADFLLEEKLTDNSGCDEFNDVWNIYCYQIETECLTQVTGGEIEFGYPHWQYGDHRLVQLTDSALLTVGSSPSGDQLFLIDQESLQVQPLKKTTSTIQRLFSDGSGCALMVELPVDDNARIIKYEFDHELGFDQSCHTLKSSTLRLTADDVSVAEHISFDCRDGQQGHGFYYPPCNKKYADSSQSSMPPPLIVMVHGGPTARAYGHFDIQKQFWTSRGFALFDVNHRGSSGYGRHYRDALYGQWGEIDCADVIDGIDLLVAQGKANSEQVCIRGKSAGGYAVLRALTQYPETFKVGACYYGIGNLATLAQSTHKFEQHYTDRLIGEAYNIEKAHQLDSRFYQRSPIHDVGKLKSSMIVFQGALDHVVPPEVAHEIINSLAESGVDHEYVEYADEAHGFRQVTNNIDAWSKELAFYRRVLSK